MIFKEKIKMEMKQTNKLKKELEDILLEAWHDISDFKSDGREFPRSDKLSEYADKILELFEKSNIYKR